MTNSETYTHTTVQTSRHKNKIKLKYFEIHAPRIFFSLATINKDSHRKNIHQTIINSATIGRTSSRITTTPVILTTQPPSHNYPHYSCLPSPQTDTPQNNHNNHYTSTTQQPSSPLVKSFLASFISFIGLPEVMLKESSLPGNVSRVFLVLVIVCWSVCCTQWLFLFVYVCL